MRRNRGRLLICLGLLLILAALGLTVYNLKSTAEAEEESAAVTARLITYREAVTPSAGTSSPSESGTLPGEADPGEAVWPDYVLDPTREMPVVEIDGIGYVGTLQIPALELELPVAAEWSYSKLRIAPCRYSGTAYAGNLVICAHNYTVHFGRLGNLPVGAEVLFTDMDGNVFHYETASVEILCPAMVEEMIESEYPLSLFTCTLGNRTRLTVRCIGAEE